MIDPSKYKDVAFSTFFNYERLSKAGSFSWALPNAAFVTQTFSVAHNLGYKPYFKAWVKMPSGKIQVASSTPNSYEPSSGVELDEAYTDNNNLYFTLANFSGSVGGSGIIYYRIYEEQAA